MLATLLNRKRHILSGLLALLFCGSPGLPARAQQEDSPRLFEVSATKYLLGTKVDFLGLHPDIPDCKKAFYFAFKEIERLENQLSSSISGSEVHRINQTAGVQPAKVSQETFELIQRAVAYSTAFGGDFDITVGPLTELWGFSGENEVALPDRQKLHDLLNLVNFRDIVLSAADTTVFLPHTGMEIDLGGIAKGYAIDRAAVVLTENGLQHFLINAGGDVYARGSKYGGRKWAIGLQHPRKSADLLATFELQDFAVATSGDYERYKFINGKRYHHIIDPRTGFPGERNQSVTVFANSAELADVLATFLFISGPEGLSHLPTDQSFPTIFVSASGDITCNDSLKNRFNLVFLN